MTRFLVAGVIALCAAITANAEVFVYQFTLDGLQEVPPNASPATGAATVTLNDVTNDLAWNIAYSGLLGSITGAHFHAPAAPGQNAGIALGVSIGPSPLVGNATITDTLEGHIKNGMCYFNIHSTVFPGGEIRGQVTPEPTTLALFGLGLLALRRYRRA